MIKITYLVTLRNKEKEIKNTISSLKNIKGDFTKEFIIIDDGSTDSSLEVIKQNTLDLPNTFIISQKYMGSSVAINNGIKLSQGDYIQFINGGDVLREDATEILLEACLAFKSNVAFCKYQKVGFETKKHSENQIIEFPIKEILKSSIEGVADIGSSGSLVSSSLIKKIAGPDQDLFCYNPSLALRCALYSSFIFVPKSLAFYYTKETHDKNFIAYNNLKALLNFISINHQILDGFKQELYEYLLEILWRLNLLDFRNMFKYFTAKIFENNISKEGLLQLYQKTVTKLL